MQLSCTTYIHSAIKERALAKHKSTETQVLPVAASSHSQVQKSSSSSKFNVQKSETLASRKKWKTVYSKYRASGSEVRPQAFKSDDTDFATSNMARSTTTVVPPFPGFANLGARKDQSFTKNRLAARNQDNSPVVPLQYDIGKKEQDVRAGYLMPDEELLQKWTNAS